MIRDEFVSLSTNADAAQIVKLTFGGNRQCTIRADDVVAVRQIPAEPRSQIFVGPRAVIYLHRETVEVRSSAVEILAALAAVTTHFDTRITLSTFLGPTLYVRAASASCVESLPDVVSPKYKGPVARIYFGGHSEEVRATGSTGAPGGTVTVTTTINTAIARISNYALVRDEKPNGTDGGTFPQGDWRTRDLTAIVKDEDGMLSLASNQLTFQRGKYLTRIRCPCFRAKGHSARLQDVDNNVTLLDGGTQFLNGPSSGAAWIVGTFIFTVETLVEIQHSCEQTRSGDGFGVASSLGAPEPLEIYTEAEFWRFGR